MRSGLKKNDHVGFQTEAKVSRVLGTNPVIQMSKTSRGKPKNKFV